MAHTSVLPDETLELLNPHSGDVVLDATVNGGGHAALFLEHVGVNGKVIGMDRDASVLACARERFAAYANFIPICGNYRDAEILLSARKIKKVNCALLDLGMSSWQLEHSGRGFSFLRDEPLLMTFEQNPRPEHTAYALLQRSTEKELEYIFRTFGEERYAGRIARAIAGVRRRNPIRSSKELAELIVHSVPGTRRGGVHPATRVFQALRIAVNDELGALADGLSVMWRLLTPGGRIAAISFHSLEDRVVKQFFRKKADDKEGELVTKKPITPGAMERLENPRARSAKLRVIMKL